MDLDAAKKNQGTGWRLSRVATWVCFLAAGLILLTSLFGASADPLVTTLSWH